jgi:hypothetical protein
MAYAEGTKVPQEASRAEIERTLRRYKAEGFAYASDGDQAHVLFRMAGRMIRFTLTMPQRNQWEFNHYKRGYQTYRRAEGVAEQLWDQACRQKWRALALVIKAKLEAVDAGITTVEDEFLANTLMADGRPFGEWAKPQIDRMYVEGGMPQLLIGGPK